MAEQIFRWWLIVELVGLAALPLSFTLFRRLPDHGHSFAKALGILLVSYGAWLAAMLGFAGFDLPSLLVSVLLMLAIGLLLARRARVGALSVLRGAFPAMLLHEMLFAVALYVGLVLRWRGIYGAQINHTETPMDFALLNGILASVEFPPQDPWLANYPINYYYFGYVMVAALTVLSGLPSEVTFTLGAATVFALTATGVAGLVWNLFGIDAGDTQKENVGTRTALKRPRVLRPLSAMAAVIFVLVAGNQVAALQWITRSEAVVALRGAELGAVLVQALRGQPLALAAPLPPIPWEPAWGEQQSLPQADVRREAVSSWWPSRAVWDQLHDGDGRSYRTYTITEFPFFSFLLGDLHPHVLSLPWTLLVIALSLNLLTRPSAPEWSRPWMGIVELFVTAVALGGLYAINSWDLPTYILLFLGSLLLLYARLAPVPGRIVWPHFLKQALILLIAAWAVWLPFHMSFVALVGADGLPLARSPVHTPFAQFVVVFGLFAVPLAAFVVRSPRGVATFRRFQAPVPMIAMAAGAALIAAGVVLDFALLFLLPFALWAVLLAYRSRERPARSFALWATALGALVIWGTEVVYLRDVFEGHTPRMNTLFKFYYQVWLIWGTLAGYVLWVLLRRWSVSTVVWFAPFALLLVGSLVYPALAPARGPGDRTLDGIEYIKRERPADAAAIAWVRQNIPGDAVVLQAPFHGGYHPEYAGVATATGRPTVLGWKGHEDQWRGGQPEVRKELEQRLKDVTTVFTTQDPAQARELLSKYRVDYVYVGPVERQFAAENGAPAEALTKFDQFMEPVWREGDAVIYRVPS